MLLSFLYLRLKQFKLYKKNYMSSLITTSVRTLLSNPFVYELFQNIMGADKARKSIVSEFIEPYLVNNILDIGCGPAEILTYLPNVNYYGFDISNAYIERAKIKYGEKGKFFTKYLDTEDLNWLPKFDLVLMLGVLHHMDDNVATDILSIAHNALKSEGRLLTIDPVYDDRQSYIARFLVSKDRGQYVRTREEYLLLATYFFNNVNIDIRYRKWIPYTHCIMECSLY